MSIGGIINISSDDSLASMMDMFEKVDITKINAKELNQYDGSVHIDQAVLKKYQRWMQETKTGDAINTLKSLQGKSYTDAIKVLELHF